MLKKKKKSRRTTHTEKNNHVFSLLTLCFVTGTVLLYLSVFRTNQIWEIPFPQPLHTPEGLNCGSFFPFCPTCLFTPPLLSPLTALDQPLSLWSWFILTASCPGSLTPAWPHFLGWETEAELVTLTSSVPVPSQLPREAGLTAPTLPVSLWGPENSLVFPSHLQATSLLCPSTSCQASQNTCGPAADCDLPHFCLQAASNRTTTYMHRTQRGPCT